MTLGALPYILALVLMLIGLYVVVAKKNIIKIILGVCILEYAVNLFLLLLGYRHGGAAPIRTAEQADTSAFAAGAVDPIPQALILTSIVIGLGCLALMVSLAVRLHEKFGTFDMTRIRELKG
ncbi:MAG: NADH-quinone oxidoreductase subunit K [Planctomycetota bacterium]|nr:MAG: NADH-quinone oxidoreductase subunit K [Planctomycetota bacterium]